MKQASVKQRTAICKTECISYDIVTDTPKLNVTSQQCYHQIERRHHKWRLMKSYGVFLPSCSVNNTHYPQNSREYRLIMTMNGNTNTNLLSTTMHWYMRRMMSTSFLHTLRKTCRVNHPVDNNLKLKWAACTSSSSNYGTSQAFSMNSSSKVRNKPYPIIFVTTWSKCTYLVTKNIVLSLPFHFASLPAFTIFQEGSKEKF